MPLDDTARLLETVLRLRLARSAILPRELVTGEQAYDMLLVLFLADARGERIGFDELVKAVGAPTSVAGRWLRHLVEIGLVAGEGDPPFSITLSPAAIEALEDVGGLLRIELAALFRTAPEVSHDRRRDDQDIGSAVDGPSGSRSAADRTKVLPPRLRPHGKTSRRSPG